MSGLEIRERISPNAGPRRDVAAPDLVIVHYTDMRSAEEALHRLCDPQAQVSAHYLIAPDGVIWRLVAEESRAWHAGVSFWGAGPGACAETDINSRSLGIELAHPGHSRGACPPFPERQMAALEDLLVQMLDRWSIRPHEVLAHSDVAPGRKIDPGEKFDWARLARRGLAAPAPVIEAAGSDDVADVSSKEMEFRAALAQYGYGDWPLEALLDAFHRRWRPKALGAALSSADLALARALAGAAQQ